MAAEPLWVLAATAWAAGVMEGASLARKVRQNTRKIESDGRRPPLPDAQDTASVVRPGLISSLLYGTVALPFSLVGASPGPAFFSWLPSPSNSTSHLSNNKDTTHRNVRAAKLILGDDTTQQRSFLDETATASTADMSERVKMIRMARRKPTTTPPKQQQPTRPAVAQPPRVWTATLDGRPLATPLAEAMRRSRFLMAGVGMVSVVLLNLSSSSPEDHNIQPQTVPPPTEPKTEPKIVPQKEPAVAQPFAKISAIRLVPPSMFWNKDVKDILAEQPGRLPCLLTTSTQRQQGTTTKLPYWSLYDTIHGNNAELPNDDCMIGEKPRYLVVEANLSKSLGDYWNHYNDSKHPPILKLEQIALASNLIARTGIRKGLLEESSESSLLVTILIGSGPAPTLPPHVFARPYIYLDGMDSLLSELESSLKRMVEQQHILNTPLETNTHGGDNSALEEESTSDENDHGAIFWFLDSLGRGIRTAGTWPIHGLSALVNAIRPATPQTLFVLSDNERVQPWLEQRLQDWKIVWLDASKRDEVDRFQQQVLQDDNLGLLCCNRDDTLFELACSVLQPLPQTDRVLVVAQDSDTTTSIQNVLRELRDDGDTFRLPTLSLQNVHSELFNLAQRQLLEGELVPQTTEQTTR